MCYGFCNVTVITKSACFYHEIRFYLYCHLPQKFCKTNKGTKLFSVNIDICFIKDMNKNIPPTTHSVVAKSITIFERYHYFLFLLFCAFDTKIDSTTIVRNNLLDLCYEINGLFSFCYIQCDVLSYKIPRSTEETMISASSIFIDECNSK